MLGCFELTCSFFSNGLYLKIFSFRQMTNRTLMDHLIPLRKPGCSHLLHTRVHLNIKKKKDSQLF